MTHTIKDYETTTTSQRLDGTPVALEISGVKCSCNRAFKTVAEWSEHATEAQQIHIEGLQVTLRQRNAQIEHLRPGGGASPAEMRREYRRGWKDAAGHLMTTTRKAANDLRKIRSDAFEVYLQGDKIQ